jgi:hypothetical protein
LYGIREIIKKPIQLCILLILIATILSTIPFFLWSHNFRQKAMKNLPKGYVFPMPEDYLITVYATIFFCALDYVAKTQVFKLFRPYCKEQTD